MTMTDLAPARCPGCGSPVKMTLTADPLTPIYLCNSTPARIVCVPEILRMPGSLRIANLAVPTDAELDELAELIDAVTIAWTPSTGRIGLCEVMHCESVAVDGRCLTHA